jgi:hypothetical protein
VQSNGDQVCLYTHYRGYALPLILRAALLRGRERWDNPSHLARIIFCEMIKDSVMDLTGYGISATIIDGANRVLLVNVDDQTVKVGERVYSFEQYITYEDVNWDQFYG